MQDLNNFLFSILELHCSPWCANKGQTGELVECDRISARIIMNGLVP